MTGESLRVLHLHAGSMTTSGVDTESRSMLPRGLIGLLGMTGLLVSVLALQQFASILAPVLLALILVIGVHPLTGILRRRGAPMWIAVTISLITGPGPDFGPRGGARSLRRPAGDDPADLPGPASTSWSTISVAGSPRSGSGVDQIRAGFWTRSTTRQHRLCVLGGILGFRRLFSNLLFLLFVVAFMALDAVGFSGRLSRARRQRAEVVGALDTFVDGTRSYLLVSTVFGLIVAAIDTGFLWLSASATAAVGLLAFITNYIPNVGFIVGLVPPALLALLEGGPRPDGRCDRGVLSDQLVIQSSFSRSSWRTPSISRSP